MSFKQGPRTLAALIITAVSLPALAAPGSAPPKVEVMSAARHDVSAPMREIIKSLPPIAPVSAEVEPRQIPNRFLKPKGTLEGRDLQALRTLHMQSQPSNVPAPSIGITFDGQDFTSCGGGCLPPDTNGDVSPNEYIQWVNTSWAIYNKATGARTSGPTAGNSFFAGFGGECAAPNDGDPIALWDDAAQRWVMSQFVTSPTNGAIGGAQCVAISTTSDPLGTYYRYEFDFPYFGDYPHFGVWRDESGTQDAYLLVTHEFDAANANAFVGAAFIALERDKMLQGLPAKMVRFAGNDAYGAEAVHLDGNVPAAAGACPIFMHFDPAASDYLFWDMCINWTTPASTTLSATAQRVAAVGAFVPNYNDVGQPGTASALDSFGTHIMYRAAGRAFPVGAPFRLSVAANHAVLGAGASGGVKWVQFGLEPQREYYVPDADHIFRDAFGDLLTQFSGTPQTLVKRIVEEGTYAPDAKIRWMGGVAIDASADVGLGMSVASTTQAPDLRTTGRLLNDATGQLRDEVSCTGLPSTGSQTSSSGRWGDYSAMSVDPADQCTFWFTSEYHPVTSSASWHTRICSFKFAECGLPSFKLVSDSPRRLQICGATATGDPTWNLRVGVLNSYSAAVTLATTGAPAGTTPSYSLNPLPTTPGKSILTLGGGAALASGEYAFSVNATNGTINSTVALELGVSATAAAQVALATPADGATGQSLYPTLTWTASPGALSYKVEVSTNPAFSSIAAQATVSGTTYQVPVLLTTGTYYWRVTANNYCGASTVSLVRSFTTLAAGACPAGTSLTNVFADAINVGSAWTAGGTGGAAWSVSAAPPGGTTTTASWFGPNNTVTSDRTLDSPAIAIPAGAQQVYLSYDTFHRFETDPPAGCWDSASMEVKAGAASYAYLDFSHMLTDPYNGTNSDGAPLSGRRGWCYTSGANKHAVVSLKEFAGQSVQVRFRATSDSNTAGAVPNGMYVDNVSVDVCQ